MRPSGRRADQIRALSVEVGYMRYAEGSCLIKIGNTHVVCTATIDEKVPPFLKGQNQGWVTAEYSMLPRSTHQRVRREINRPNGRTQEIQRLISRSLRSAVDLKKLGERQIIVDCDVVSADGGTRTAAITGGYVALHLAIRSLLDRKIIKSNPLIHQVAAISCGVYNNEVVVDLDYNEDSVAEVDANFIFASNGNMVEVQMCAEKESFTDEQLMQMMQISRKATEKLFIAQNNALLQ